MVNYICIDADGHKVARRINSREEYISICNSAENRRNWENYRRTGEDRYKQALVQMAYNCQVSDGGLLKGCQTVSPFFFHDIDCRDEQECHSIIGRLLAMKEELGLVEVSESASHGVHVVCRREPGRTILECQVRVAMLTRIEMDTNNKENNRVVFHGPIDETTTPLLDDELFASPLSDEEAAAEYKRLKEREQQGLEEVPAGASKANKHYQPWEDTPSASETNEQPQKPSDALSATIKDPSQSTPVPLVTPADRRTRFIARGVMKEKGLEPNNFIDEGGRHTSVKMFLSGATPLLTKAEANGMLAELMPDHWADQNIQKLVDDFYQKYNDPSQRLLKYQEALFTESRKLINQNSTNGNSNVQAAYGEPTETAAPVYGDTAPLTDIYSSQLPPVMSAKKPGLVKLVSSRTPDSMKATVEQGMFPPLGVYPRDLSFMYIDQQPRELRMNCMCIAETGSGKDTCLKQPLKHITAPMVARDAVSRQRLKKYFEDYNSKAASKEKPKRPEGAVVQCVSANLTAARLAQLMDDSQGAFLYTHLHEFDQWYGIEGKTGSSCSFLNLKLADDEDNPFGQERAGTQSVNYTGPLGLNWNASTTPSRAQQMFRFVTVDGPISRVCLATTPNRGLGAPIPKYGRYDERYDTALQPYIDNLKAATGLIDCKPARRLIERLKAECDQFTQQTQDEVFDNLTHRALVHAFRKACCLYAANGMKWERSIEGFCRWSLHYDLWLKMHFFGDMIRHADSQTQTSHRGPQNLLAQLSEEFTKQDAVNVRLMNNKDEDGTGNMLSQWLHRGYIEKKEDKYRKV